MAVGSGLLCTSFITSQRKGRQREQMVGRTVCAVLVALAIPLWAPTPLFAAFPGENGKIAYESTPDHDYEVSSVNPDGTGVTQLTMNTMLIDASAGYSADGKRITFNRSNPSTDNDFDIFVMNADGTGQVQLTNGGGLDFRPGFSPDGRRIVFESDRDGDREIYSMKTDGTDVVQLTSNAAVDFGAVYSPDGSRIAFASNRDGQTAVYTMNTNGSGVQQLTDAAFYNASPSFSPDGQRIVFESYRDGTYEIYVMNADGSGEQRLTTNAEEDKDPVFSPDGTRIAFSRYLGNGNYDIFTINANGGGEVNVTNSWDREQSPDWQPAPPANDGFASASQLSGANATGSVGIGAATKEAGEPNHADDAGGHSVWWRWTAPSSGQVTVNTCASNFDTLLAVYTGTTLGSLTPIVSNDDALTGCPGRGAASRASFATVAGTTYRIAVDGFNGATGNASLALNLVVPDTTPPETTIREGAATGPTTADPTPQFDFSSSELNSSFECSVDGSVFTTCATPQNVEGETRASFTASALADGSHTFSVRAIDAAANIDSTPSSRQFVVDTVPPGSSILSGPAAGAFIRDNTPTFVLGATERNARFQCKVDAATTFTACPGTAVNQSATVETRQTSTFGPLADGAHKITVRALDAANNADATPVVRSFTVDTRPPDTTITGPAQTTDRTPTFTFGPAGSTFRCALDGAPLDACPASYTPPARLGFGNHTLRAIATDRAGNTDPTAASKAFKVVRP